VNNNKVLFLFCFIFIVGSMGIVSADFPKVILGQANPGSTPYVEVYTFPNANATVSNSSIYWGPYQDPSDIAHAQLSGLGWAQSGHYINSNVDFNNYSLINATNINATTGYFQDVHVANSTLYIGESITLSAGGMNGSVLNVSGGNVSADYYYGSGKFLTDINLTGISFVGGAINASNFNGGNFSGWFNWSAIAPYLYFDGYTLIFNESYLNDTIKSQAEVQVYYEIVNMTTSGGNVYATVPSLIDFEIKQITVVPTTPNTNYRFEAVEFTSGDYIDKNRMVHVGTWDIAKNYAINDMINLSITSASNDELFTVTIKYLDNFRNL
jgi:uncharacterized protein YjbI with pentapeptide repeats